MIDKIEWLVIKIQSGTASRASGQLEAEGEGTRGDVGRIGRVARLGLRGRGRAAHVERLGEGVLRAALEEVRHLLADRDKLHIAAQRLELSGATDNLEKSAKILIYENCQLSGADNIL